MYFSQTWQEILNWSRAFADIIIVWFILYYAIKVVRNNSRTIQIFKGIVLVLIVDWLAKILGLSTVSWLSGMFVSFGFLAVIVIFQPEIRGLLEKLGKSNVLSKISTLSGNEKERLVEEITKAVTILSKEQTGALITLEQSQSLSDYISTGTTMNSLVTAELLTTIFVPYTALHDGAVIIQGDKLACASAYFPPTNLQLPNRFGARHRAAIGISEVTDSVTVVVSEETGVISIAEAGKIHAVTIKELRNYLLRVLCNEETELQKQVKSTVDSKSFYVVEEPVEVVSGSDVTKTNSSQERVGLFGKLAVKRQKSEEETAEEAQEIKVPKNKNKLFKKRNTKTEENSNEVVQLESLNIEENNEVKTEEVIKDAAQISLIPEVETVIEEVVEQESANKAKAVINDASELLNNSSQISIEEALEIVIPKKDETPAEVEHDEGGEE